MQTMDALVKTENICTGTSHFLASVGQPLQYSSQEPNLPQDTRLWSLHTHVLALRYESDDRGAVTSICSPTPIGVGLLAPKPVHILLKRMNKTWYHQSFSLLKFSGVE